MNIRQLETFLAVAKCGSFSHAAEILRATTSTVSIRIRELEVALGVTLFERSKHGVRLTAVGRELESYAAKATSAFADIRAFVGKKEAYSGTIRLGVTEMIAITWLPKLVHSIRVQFPKLSLELTIDLTNPLMNRLRKDDLDLVLAPGKSFEQSLRAHPLGQVRFVWMEGGASVIGNDIIDQEALRKCRIVSWGKDSFHYHTTLSWLGEERRETAIDFVNSVEILASMVKSGMGIGLLPVNRYRAELDRGELRTLRMWQPMPSVSFYAVHRSEAPGKITELIVELAQRVSDFSPNLPQFQS